VGNIMNFAACMLAGFTIQVCLCPPRCLPAPHIPNTVANNVFCIPAGTEPALPSPPKQPPPISMPFLVPGGTPYNIFGGPGYCAVSSATSTISCANPNSNGSTASEQFVPYSPSGSSIILPGDGVIWKSSQTGLYCRVTNTPSSIACDQSSAVSASNFTYTGACISLRQCPPLAINI
jgi:hypothetical protein